jgi:hypothetical protein
MQAHKFVVYTFDFQGFGYLEFQRHIMFGVPGARSFYEGSADIGEWSDDHELNEPDSTQLTFNKYFNGE